MPQTDTMTLGCHTCDVVVHIPTEEAQAQVGEVRDFFVTHTQCATFVDLVDRQVFSRGFPPVVPGPSAPVD